MNTPTLQTLHKWSIRAIILFVTTKLIKQGKKSQMNDNEGSICAYRGQHGCKCAVGWVIDDPEYRDWMEKHGINATHEPITIELIDSGSSRCVIPVPAGRHDILYKLQQIHDQQHELLWARDFAQLLRQHGEPVPASITVQTLTVA